MYSTCTMQMYLSCRTYKLLNCATQLYHVCLPSLIYITNMAQKMAWPGCISDRDHADRTLNFRDFYTIIEISELLTHLPNNFQSGNGKTTFILYADFPYSVQPLWPYDKLWKNVHWSFRSRFRTEKDLCTRYLCILLPVSYTPWERSALDCP